MRAHRLVNRPSQDLDAATGNSAPTTDIAATLRGRDVEARARRTHALGTAPPAARFAVCGALPHVADDDPISQP